MRRVAAEDEMVEEEDEVVTAWRVVKRRIAKGKAGGTRGATVYASRVEGRQGG